MIENERPVNPDADYVGKTIRELENEILRRCRAIGSPSKPRPFEVRRMGWQLLMLSLLEPHHPSDRTLEALAALLGVGTRSRFPIVAPAKIHHGDLWVKAVIWDGMHLYIHREGRLTEQEQRDSAVALADGFGTSDENLAKHVGVRPDSIHEWRRLKHSKQYRDAIEFIAANMVPGPAHPESDTGSDTGLP